MPDQDKPSSKVDELNDQEIITNNPSQPHPHYDWVEELDPEEREAILKEDLQQTLYPDPVHEEEEEEEEEIIIPRGPICQSARKWLDIADKKYPKGHVLIGSRTNAIVDKNSRNLIFGKEKSLKTTFMLRLAVAHASGLSLIDGLPVLTSGKVLYLHGELGAIQIGKRAQGAFHGIKERLDDVYDYDDLIDNKFWMKKDPRFSLCPERDRLGNYFESEGQHRIRLTVKKYRPDILVIDPWQSFFNGDENNGEEVRRAAKFMDLLIEDYDLTIYLVIHSGKNLDKGPRGHSSIAGWRDTQFSLLYNNEKQRLTVTVAPRFGDPPDPIILDFDKEVGTVFNAHKGIVFPSGVSAMSVLAPRPKTSLEKMTDHIGLQVMGVRLPLAELTQFYGTRKSLLAQLNKGKKDGRWGYDPVTNEYWRVK